MIGLDWNALTVDEGVQDGHGTVGDTGVGVNLLEDLVDVGRVGLLSGLGALLLLARGGGGLLASLLLLSGCLASGCLAGGGGSLLEWESVECAKKIASKRVNEAVFAHLCLLGSHFERFGSFDAVFGCVLKVGDGGGMSW